MVGNVCITNKVHDLVVHFLILKHVWIVKDSPFMRLSSVICEVCNHVKNNLFFLLAAGGSKLEKNEETIEIFNSIQYGLGLELLLIPAHSDKSYVSIIMLYLTKL